MTITTELINAYYTLLTNPSENGLNFIAITDFFEPSDIVTPKHLLAKAYMDYMEAGGRPLNKLVVYIVMDKALGLCNGKASGGELGYHLKPKNYESKNS